MTTHYLAKGLREGTYEGISFNRQIENLSQWFLAADNLAHLTYLIKMVYMYQKNKNKSVIRIGSCFIIFFKEVRMASMETDNKPKHAKSIWDRSAHAENKYWHHSWYISILPLLKECYPVEDWPDSILKVFKFMPKWRCAKSKELPYIFPNQTIWQSELVPMGFPSGLPYKLSPHLQHFLPGTQQTNNYFLSSKPLLLLAENLVVPR